MLAVFRLRGQHIRRVAGGRVVDAGVEHTAYLRAGLTVPVERLRERAAVQKRNSDLLRKCHYDSDELWHCPPQARQLPDPLVRGRCTVESWLAELRAKARPE